MSLRLLQKQVGAAPSESSAEAKATTQPQGRKHAGGGHGRQGGSDGGYHQRGAEARGSHSSNGGYGEGGGGSGGGGYYSSAGSGGHPGGGSSHPTVAAPKPGGRFSGSDAQRAHVEAVKAANRKEAAAPTAAPTSDVAVRSDLGLAGLKERKRAEEEERQAKREAARARRHNETTQREADDERALAECEEQASRDCEQSERVKYEAALIVRIAVRFGTAGVWMKIAEARARGADIPMDPRRIYLLAHPDKCPLEEASDATAILNAQRPPEMTEAQPRTRPAAKSSTPDVAASATPASASPPTAGATAAETESGGAPPESTAAAGAGDERRTDPEDNQLCTLQELRRKYAGTYAPAEVDDYWQHDCVPQPSPVRRTEAQPRTRPAAKASTTHDVAASATPASARPAAGATAAKAESGGAPPEGAAAAGAGDERRTDPEDGQLCTLQELRRKYAGRYSPAETDDYWRHDCVPRPPPGVGAKRW